MSVLDDARALIERQIGELDEEANRLRSVLGHLGKPTAPGASGRRTRRSRNGSGPRAKHGQRRQEFLDAVAKKPGISVAEVAGQLGIVPQPLYAIAKTAVEEKAVTKDGSGYVLAARPTAPRAKAKPKGRAKAKGAKGSK